MNKKFVIDGKPVELEIQKTESSAELFRATPVESQWHQHKPTGETKFYIEGFTDSGQFIQGTFRKIGTSDDGAIILETWTDYRRVGE